MTERPIRPGAGAGMRRTASFFMAAGMSLCLTRQGDAQTPPSTAGTTPSSAGPAIQERPGRAGSGIKPAAVAPPQAEDVMVTAQRRPQRNKDVPISVSRLDAATVATILSDGSDIKGLAARVPSLNIESSFGRTFPRFYIRGLGNPDFDINAAQPVAVYYDDVVEENALLKAFPVFDIQDVEVLAGPQGTLFGRNTPAGVVKITSKLPVDDLEGYLDQSWATYDTAVTTAVVNAPVVPGKLDVRLSINNQRRDNWVKNDFDGLPEPGYVFRRNLEGFEDLAARLQALYTIDPTATVLAEFQVRHLEGTSTLFRANIFDAGSNGLVKGFDPAQVAIDGDNYQDVNNRGAHVTVHKEVQRNDIDFISAYEHASLRSRGDIDGGAPPDVPFDVETASITPAVDQFTEEARVSMNGLGRLFDQAGIYYFHEYIDNYDQDFDSTGALTTQVEEHQGSESVGVFDSASYRITSRFKIQGGVRYTDDTRTFDATRQFGFDGPLRVAGKADSADVSWDASLTYALTPDVNAYFRAATGYLPPSFQGRIDSDNFLSEARAERTTSFELGVKGALLDRRAVLTADVYQWNTHDQQLTAAGGGSDIIRLLNASTVVGRGAELQLDARPIPHLSLNGNASYNFTEIEDPNLETAGCGDGCTVLNTFDPATGNYRIDGNPLPYAPRWILNGNARYTYPLRHDDAVFFSTDWSWRSGEDFTLYRSVEFDGKPLLLGGMKLGYENYRKGYTLDVFVRNILDRVVAVGAIDFDNLEGYINDPRIVGGELHYAF